MSSSPRSLFAHAGVGIPVWVAEFIREEKKVAAGAVRCDISMPDISGFPQPAAESMAMILSASRRPGAAAGGLNAGAAASDD